MHRELNNLAQYHEGTDTLFGKDGAEGNATDSKAFIETLARRKTQGFCGTIDEEGNYLDKVYAGNVSLAQSITADYHGRFLIELIQNAYDAHPHGPGNGEVEVLLDLDVGEHGILYVANRGSPFTSKNVDALFDMGLSSKPPGESIGNKGLGFRSVLHITDKPLIFSQASPVGEKPQFDGFCFGFAEPEDFDRLISNPLHRARAAKDMPLLHVPRWLADQSEQVQSYARRAFATVIALPLRDKAAREAVLKEIQSLRQQSVPVLLFLVRLGRLTVSVVPDDDSRSFSLFREERKITGRPGATIVDLKASGTFLVARKPIAEAAMKEAIADGVEQKQLHSHWLDWEGDGEVALAVRLDAQVASTRLYAFLPLGEQAVAPFQGYMHGTFFPSSNRKTLDAEIALNALHVREAVGLAAETVVWLSGVASRGSFSDITPGKAALAAADFLVWEDVSSLEAEPSLDLASMIAGAVGTAAGAESLDDARIVPCLGSGADGETIVWRTPAGARLWDFDLATFPAESAAAHHAQTGFVPLWPRLGARLKRIDQFLAEQSADYVSAPTPQERAALAAAIAATLAANKRTPMQKWTAFYQDLIELMGKTPMALEGQEILLCSDGKLHRTMTSAPTQEGGRPRKRRRKGEGHGYVFPPPSSKGDAPDSDDDLVPPAELKNEFAFLSDRLDWHGALGSVRSYFENAKLVSPFDRDTVLSQLSQLLRQDARKGARVAGLRWAFQVWRRARLTGRPIKLRPQHRFFVPTDAGDFIDAAEAVFSEIWPKDTLGHQLQKLLDSAPADVSDFLELKSRRIAPPSHRAFNRGNIRDWVEFLTELRVQKGLHPVQKTTPRYVRAHDLRSFQFCDQLGIGPAAKALWKADIEEQDVNALNFPTSTDYVISGDLWWWPGQGDYDRLSDDCRELYAGAIVEWFKQSHDIEWSVEVHHRHNYYSDTRRWPTPFASFLRIAPWLPADEPTNEGSRRVHVSGAQLWISAETSNERFPTYLRRPAPSVARLLEGAASPCIQELKDRAELRILNDAGTLIEQTEFLAGQYEAEGFDMYFERHFINLYHCTWQLIGERYGGSQQSVISAPDRLLVRRSEETIVIDMDQDRADPDDPIYIRDNEEDETAASLVETAGLRLFDPRGGNLTRIGRTLQNLFGDSVRLLSEARYSAVVDGQPIGAGDMSPIVDRCPWLRPMLAVSMEALRGTELQRLPSDRSAIIARLERILFQAAGTLEFVIDGRRVTQDDESKRAFAFKTPDGAPLVVVRASGPLDWDTIDACLGALCEAIDQPALEPHLRILVMTLRARSVGVAEAPPADMDLPRLCASLRLRESAASAVRDTLGTRLERHLPWLRALVHLGGGDEALAAFRSVEAEAIKEPDQLRSVLSPSLRQLDLEADFVLEVCKGALTTGELRDRLGLDFEAFNRSLLAAGESPDTYPELHASLLTNYIHDNEIEIVDALRAVFYPVIKKGEAAEEYAQLREEFRSLSPDPAWELRYHEVPRDIMAERVDQWLAQHAATRKSKKPNLVPLDALRRANADAVRKFTREAGPVIRAWCLKHEVTRPALWAEVDKWADSLRARLDEAGVFDCLELSETLLFIWCQTLGVWPERMRATLDRGQLELSDDDLDAERSREKEEAEARRREARSVPFNGRSVDPETADWSAIASELADELPKSVLESPVGSPADLVPRAQPKTRDRKSQQGSKAPPAGRRAPSDKTDMIGKLGELVVYNWLKNRLPKQNIDAAWVSENSEPFTGRKGDDGLGYDFTVSFRSQALLIEVKASLSDPRMFEMGESEVRAAKAAARPRNGQRYAIAYVSNVGEPSLTRVEMLPNPMSEEGEALLRILGEGIRYGFSPRR